MALDVFRIFGGWIGVVESQVANAARGVIRDTEIQADRFRMTDMEIAVRLGWKARHDSAAMLAGCAIGSHDVADKI